VKLLGIAPLLAVTLASVQEKGCERVYRFEAPDGRGAIVLRESGNFGDSNLELRLFENGKPAVGLAPKKRDCWLSFAHATWTERPSKVAVYFGDGLCGDTWVAYDRDHSRFLPFDDMADAMRESLRASYQLSPDDLRPFHGDPLQWATASGKRGSGAPDPAATAFREHLRSLR
jgi:hypothetical protein